MVEIFLLRYVNLLPAPVLAVVPANPVKRNPVQPGPKPIRPLQLTKNLEHFQHYLLNNILRNRLIHRNPKHISAQRLSAQLSQTVHTRLVAKLRFFHQLCIIEAAVHNSAIY